MINRFSASRFASFTDPFDLELIVYISRYFLLEIQPIVSTIFIFFNRLCQKNRKNPIQAAMQDNLA